MQFTAQLAEVRSAQTERRLQHARGQGEGSDAREVSWRFPSRKRRDEEGRDGASSVYGVRVPATFRTKVLASEQTTATNQELCEQSPPLHTPHPQGAAESASPCFENAELLERNCCFTKAFLHRGGVVGSGVRMGRPRTHRAEHRAIQAWHWLQDLPNPPMQRHPKFSLDFVQLHR